MLEWSILVYAIATQQPIQELTKRYPTEDECDRDRMARAASGVYLVCVAKDPRAIVLAPGTTYMYSAP